MLYKDFGNTGERVSAIGVGTWKLGKDIESEVKALKYAISNGVTLLDTAEMYGTEGIVGSAIKGFERSKLFIATKVSPHNFHYDDVIKSCNASLSKLGIDCIDLYQLHWPNHSVPISETMSAMEKLVDDGKVRYIGVSNFSVKELDEARSSMKRYDTISDQVEYSVSVRDIENERIQEYCTDKRIAVIAYSPLGRGQISSRNYDPEAFDALSRIAGSHHKTIAQIALNWLVSKGNIFPIPKAANIEHMRENIASTDFELNDTEKNEINTLGGKRRQIGGILRPLLKKNALWSKAMTKMNGKSGKDSGNVSGDVSNE